MVDKDFCNYFMHPQVIEGIGEVYPIKIKEYNEFNELASKYLLAGRKWLTNICKYPKENYVLDFFVQNALIYLNMKFNSEFNAEDESIKLLEENDIIRYDLNEMSKLFSMSLRQEVKFELLDIMENGVIDYRFKIGDTENYITKFNYDKYRALVMEQNLLFEPLTSPSAKGNEVIQNAIKVLSKNGVSQSLASVCSAVSTSKGVSDAELQEYTYYRLMYDFETFNRVNNNLIHALFMSQGSKDVEITHLGQKIDLNKDPYANLLKRNGDNQLTRRLQG
ncbi:hypothetical protein [Clostridium sp.]|uniref:hypothetical protein n=1 Tax=Clostridium sp. TaxID=1506 RepID=UPI001B733410|nr:hypothetical protein [Clostridium sp.]MBP3914756.1 hypothetical protein [Clostridium sp.]